MAVRTPSAMEGNTSPISSTALAGLESPPMSRHTTPSAPASEFGNLALGSSSSGSSGRRMAPVTRSASRRGGNISQTPSSRQTAGSSRRPQAQAGAGSSRRTASRQPVPEDDEEDSDESSSGDESDDDETRALRIREELRRRQANVFDLFALSDPDFSTGHELYSLNNRSAESATHRAVATAVSAQAVANPAFYQSLMAVVQVPGPVWARQQLARLQRRLHDIFIQLDLNIQNPTQGQDVINTATRLRAFVAAIDHITRGRYWDAMQPETRRAFAELLLTTLRDVIARDYDPYQRAGIVRPPYAGQTAEDNNLYRRLCVNPRGPVFLIETLSGLDPDGHLLANSHRTLGTLYQAIIERHSVQGGDGRTQRLSPEPNRAFVAGLTALYTKAYRVANNIAQ